MAKKVQKNNEKLSPFVTSGIRIGTPALTTRGMKENEMKIIGHWISRVLNNLGDSSVESEIGKKVKGLCQKFPLYT